MQRFRVSRVDLCKVIREKSERQEQRQHVENYVLGLVPNVELVKEAAKKSVTEFCSQYYTKLQKCCRNFELLKTKFSVWYNNDLTITVSTELKPKTKIGRPATTFDESASERTKRLKTAHVRETNTAASLLYAASMKFRSEGNENCAKLLKMIFDDPQLAEKLLKYIRDKSTEEEPLKLSSEEALSLLLDADLGKSQYQLIRTTAKCHRADIFPAYNKICDEKKAVFPIENIVVTDSTAEVKLQVLLDHDAKRVVRLLEQTDPNVLNDIQDEDYIRFQHKWGTDGSGDHSQYNQAFNDTQEPADDSRVLLTAITPLQLSVVKEGLPPRVLWKNPTPSSVRFCKPIRIQMAKETDEAVKEEERYINSMKEGLNPSSVQTAASRFLAIHHELKLTMIDGKTRKILTDTASYARCTACDALPNQMKVSTAIQRPVNPSTFQYGMSVLHARIRFLELVLHVSYKLDVKNWAANETLYAKRKQKIISSLREELGILVDSVKRGSGSTNDGNTARRFFSNPQTAFVVTGFDEDLIKAFAIILDTINSGYEIDSSKFRDYCLKTAKEFDRLYPWYKMPSAVHLVLIHGADIIDNFDLPIGFYSEEALEARNKNIRAFREHRSRKVSRATTIFDVFYRLILTGDIFLSSLRLRRPRELMPEHIAFLLK